MLAMHEERYWPNFCRALGREELISDHRFNTMAQRSQNRHLLIPLLEEIFAGGTTEDWNTRLRQYDLPWEPMQTADQVIADPQTLANDYMVEIDHPVWGQHKQVATPIQFHKTSFKPYRPAPELGQHTQEVLLEVGYSRKEIDELEAAGVIRCGQKVGQRK